MKIISLEFTGDGTFSKPAMATLVLGDHATDGKDTHYLSNRCASGNELEEQGEYLKRLIDDAVKKGKKKFEQT